MRTDHFKRLLTKLDELTGSQQAILRRELALRSKKPDALK